MTRYPRFIKENNYYHFEKIICIVSVILFSFFAGCTAQQLIPNDEEDILEANGKYSDLNYSGDGNLTDYGRQAGILRFVLDLGAVDLTKASVSKFELKGLPQVEFVCYLRVHHPLPTLGKPKDFEAGDLFVGMSLEDENDTKVFSENALLSNWTWSGSVGDSKSDLYTRKSIFTPMKGKVYYLNFKNKEGNLKAPKAQILLMGGGWKAR
jgi:hypothetical protein